MSNIERLRHGALLRSVGALAAGVGPSLTSRAILGHGGGSICPCRRGRCVAVLVVLVGSLVAASTSASQAPDPRFDRWLEEVQPIISRTELGLFRTLRHDYQRDAFIERFWRVRDPFLQTARNEMRERYEERVAYSRANYDTLADDRARILMVHGEPSREIQVRCTTTRIPAVIWAFNRSDHVNFSFLLVFLRSRGGLGPARVWRPGLGGTAMTLVRSSRACINGILLDQVVQQILSAGSGYQAKLDRVLMKPRPRSMEWVAAFSAESTDLPADASEFDCDLSVDYLGRYQNRTAVQSVVEIDPAVVTIGEYAGHRSYDFLVTGEILLGNRLFETFRYKFGYPGDGDGQRMPLAFQRFLRPGDYRMLLKLEDLNGHAFARFDRRLEVPLLAEIAEVEPIADRETSRLFQEATTALARGESTIRLMPPSDQLQTGLVRFDTLVTGSTVTAVNFFLNDKPILTKTRPPYNVELDLGQFPRVHRVRVESVDEEGSVLAVDELELNSEGQRFAVRLVEPRRGARYHQSLLARADVRLPDGATLEKLEFFLNEEPAATLYQEPFVQPLALGDPGKLTYVRVVAHLADGNTTEDLVFVNAPDHLEEVKVQFVELYAAVVDRSGRPVEGLEIGDFRVIEDGDPQQITRFERVENLAIHVGVLIDNSASMAGSLEEVRRAALRFLEQAITPRDRAAVITFNRFPDLRVKLTSELRLLGGGLAGLTAEGQTALYDSLMFTLYYFAGVTGQRAILLLSDGLDEVSRFSFEETLEYARRAGVAIYPVGLKMSEGASKRRLNEIARETGGQSYYIRNVEELGEIYATIQRELRSLYLLAYQSSNTARDDRFRSVEVKVRRSGARVKTMSGYYP